MTKETTYVGELPEAEPEPRRLPESPSRPVPSANRRIPGPPRASEAPRASEPRDRQASPRSQSVGGANRKAFFPQQPRTIADTGLSLSMVEELVIKSLFFASELRGSDIAQRIKLPQVIVDDVVDGLRKQKLVDLKGSGGAGVGRSGMVYTLTSYATDLLRQILDRNRYNGPAPVRMDEWARAVSIQSVRGMRIRRDRMERHFENLVVQDAIFDGLGPALNSGRSVFFYGPPGNGKTALCQALVNCYEGDIWVPHALLIDDFIIRVFDATVHQPIDDDGGGPAPDARWVKIRRPLVVVGGELTLPSLDLIYSTDVKYYEAPFQLKATNGMLLIDDFGRQQVAPKDLLNRWIVPLENDVDYLTLHTGKKLKVPFDVFVAFSTNLEPSDLVDDAFLRRVRYKLAVTPPDEAQYMAIWDRVCRSYGVSFDRRAIAGLVQRHYQRHRRGFAACEPRDLLEQVIDIAHYRGEPARLTEELLDAAAENYFVRFTRRDK